MTIIHLSVPAGTYKDITQAHREANAIKKYIQYHYNISEYYYKITIYVSNIKPSRAEYVFIPSGKGRPSRKLLANNINEAYTEPHLHISIEANYNANAIANAIIIYLMNHHTSAKNKNYRLHVYKKYIVETPEIFKKYVEKQAKYIVKVKPLKNIITDDFHNDFCYYIALLACISEIAENIVLYEEADQIKQFRNYVFSKMNEYLSKKNKDEYYLISVSNCLDYIYIEALKYYRHILAMQEKLLCAEKQASYFYGEK